MNRSVSVETGGFSVYEKVFSSSQKGKANMNLADSRLEQLANPSLTPIERIYLQCELASEFIYSGQYEAAQEVLGDLWRGVGVRPKVDNYPPKVGAEILLQCGCLSGWLGSSQPVRDSQEQAKDLLFESLRIFESQNNRKKVSEAQYELGMCYWRLGAFEEARTVLNEAFRGTGTPEQKGKIQLRQTLIELSTGRHYEAWDLLKQIQIDNTNDALKGRWHGQMALVLRRLATVEGRWDYADRAILEYTAAIYHCEQAGHERYCGNSSNNLAFLLLRMGRYAEAHQHLDRAEVIFKRLKDSGNVAQVDETRARVYLAEGLYTEAQRFVVSAIDVLEKSGEQALLVDALTLKAVIQERLGNHESSLAGFNHAIDLGKKAGALSSVGQAILSMIEEHSERLTDIRTYTLYSESDQLLSHIQDIELITRLRVCARMVIKKLGGLTLTDENFTLPEAVLEYERKFIEEALINERGIITRAAKRLGISRQVLSNMINTRHKNLLDKRSPIVTRYRSIIKK
jgi:tetratricopeptide (TPR) repeat protein